MIRSARLALAVFALAIIPLALAPRLLAQTASEDALVAKAKAIHERIITIDTHDDIPDNFATADVDPGVRGTRQVDLPKMREGGLDVAFFVVFVGQGPRTPDGYAKARAEALTKFEAIHRLAEKMHPDQIQIAYTPDQVEQIVKGGKLATVIGVENGYPLGRDLAAIRQFYDLGGRYLTLSHGGHNDIADSATPREGEAEAEHNGLSEFGKQVVAELNRVGMMVDVSHVSKKAALDAIAVSKAPIIASHSGARAVNDNARNMDDETLLALKANGGVIQCVGLGAFVKNDPPEKAAAVRALRAEFGLTGGGGRGGLATLAPERRAEYEKKRAALDDKWPPANVQDFVNHIDHVVKLIGIDHAGISSDFDGGGGVRGWGNAAESLNVTIELVRRGYTEDQIRKLWGGNLLRVWREVERRAAPRH